MAEWDKLGVMSLFRHRRRVAPIGILLIALLGACGGGSSSTTSSSSKAAATLKVRDEAAELRRQAHATFALARDGQSLVLGDTVRTNGTGFAQVNYVDGSLTRLDSNAQFTLTDLANARRAERVVGRLNGGRAWSEVKKISSSEGRYEIDTAVATAAVRGTQFDINCTAADGSCIYTVVAGVVGLTPRGGEETLLHAGDSATVRPGQRSVEAEGPQTRDELRQDAWIAKNLDIDASEEGRGTGSSAPPSASDIVYVGYYGHENNDPDLGAPAVQIDCVRHKGCTLRNPFTGDGDPATGTTGIQLEGGHYRAELKFDGPYECGGIAEETWDLVPEGTTVIDGVDVPARMTGTVRRVTHCPGANVDTEVHLFNYDSPPTHS
jgi:uncharacterized cupin superfamily protein